MRFTKFKYPLVKELKDKINEAIESISNESQEYKEKIKEEVKKNEIMLREDKIKSFVDSLIQNGRIGNPFNISTLLAIYAEGELRYKYKIPPGFMDEEKDKKDNTKRLKFGDLILWKQVLEKAKSIQRPIVFITLDEKEDWWDLDKDKTPVQPRKELFVEFKEHSEQPLVILTLTNFFNHVSVINNMVDHPTYIEMNAHSVCKKLIQHVEWDLVLDDELKLTNYLIHSGELEKYIDNILTDVETFGFSIPELEIDSVDLDSNQVIIEGSFQTKVDITLTEFFSNSYSEDLSATVSISGSISFEFEIDFEKDEDFIDLDTLNIATGGFEIIHCEFYGDEEVVGERCIDCGNPNFIHFTKDGGYVCDRCSGNYDTCPDCGYLFDKGIIGGYYCEDCRRKA